MHWCLFWFDSFTKYSWRMFEGWNTSGVHLLTTCLLKGNTWKHICLTCFIPFGGVECCQVFFLAVKHPIFCDTVFCSFKGQVTENGLLDSFSSGTSSRSPPYICSSTQFNRCKKKFMTMFWCQNFHDIFCLLSPNLHHHSRGHKRHREDRLGSKSKCDLHSQLCAGRELCSI